MSLIARWRMEDDQTLEEALEMGREFFESVEISSEVRIRKALNGYYTVYRNEALWGEEWPTDRADET